ncbi:MAG: hypothetical protein KDB00_24390 [Planctomycetales bacterium]|nr:hypothetical protein [Planctomycetales bacterium]
MDFTTAPAGESEDLDYVPRETCVICGLQAVPISNQYLVPEDTVAQLDLETEDQGLPDIFEAAGMLVTKDFLAEE